MGAGRSAPTVATAAKAAKAAALKAEGESVVVRRAEMAVALSAKLTAVAFSEKLASAAEAAEAATAKAAALKADIEAVVARRAAWRRRCVVQN